MSEESVSRPPQVRARTQRFRIGALIVLAIAVGLVLWLALRDGGSSSPPTGVTAVSVSQLDQLAASVRHPVFWLGPKEGDTYELTRSSNGTIFIRYLPEGVKVGADKPYLTVATYPFSGTFGALRSVAADTHVNAVKLEHGGIAVPAKGYPQSVHVAYPGVDYQVEVYDPTPGNALRELRSGRLAALGGFKPTSPDSVAQAPAATAATAADLKALARSLGHPLYWVGPKKGFTYEVTHPPSGKVYIRYLPRGARVGAPAPYLTVGTYPFPGAFGATKALGNDKGIRTIKLAGSGIAEISSSYPNSAHLAYPGVDYQIEVYDPSSARVRRIVTSGQVTTIG